MARIVYLFILILLVYGCVLQYKSAHQKDQKKQWHTLEFGFNLTYPDRVPNQNSALNKIADLGIHHVRIFEIFDGKKSFTYQRRLRKALDLVLKHGMQPMLSISNVPAELILDIQQRQKLDKLLPAKVAGRVAKTLRYSNRYPPNNLEQYKKKIQELLDFLFQTYGREQVVKWWFEIGNEPDAPMYFWGTIDQFNEISVTAIEVLKTNGILHVGGYGATHHTVFPIENIGVRSQAYGQLMQNNFSIANNNDYFVSFHLYERNKQSCRSEPLAGLPDWLKNSRNQVMITEWNVSSWGHKAAKVFRKPGAWGRNFIHLLIDCHRNKIDRLYLFKLMDSPLFSTFQLGAFSRTGEPKLWFSDFTTIWEVVRDGYSVQSLPHNGFSVQGRNGDRIILAGRKAVEVDADHFHLSYSAHKTHIHQRPMVSAGEWAVLALNRAK